MSSILSMLLAPRRDQHDARTIDYGSFFSGYVESEDWPNVPEIANAARHINPNSAMLLAAAFACVRITASAFMQLPLSLVDRDAEGATERKATDSRFWDLLTRQPCDAKTQAQWFHDIAQRMKQWGNAFYEIVQQRGRLRFVERYPWEIEVAWSGVDAKVYRFSPERDIQGARTIPGNRMLHFMDISFDGLVGLAPHQISDVVGLGRVMTAYNQKFFKSGGRPAGVLQMGAGTTLSDDARKTLAASFKRARRDSAFSPVLEDGVEFKADAISPVDAQARELRSENDNDVANAYGVPIELLNRPGDSKTFEQPMIELTTLTLAPLAERVKSELWLKIIAPSNEDVAIDIDLDVLQKVDFLTRYRGHSIGLKNFFEQPNEVRRELGLPDIDPEIGDQVFLPLNTMPAAQYLEALERRANPPAMEPPDPQVPDEIDENAGTPTTDGDASPQPRTMAEPFERCRVIGLDQIRQRSIDLRSSTQRDMVDIFADAQDRVTRPTVDRIRKLAKRHLPQNPNAFMRDLRDRVRPDVLELWARFMGIPFGLVASQVISAISQELDEPTERFDRKVAERSDDLIERLGEQYIDGVIGQMRAIVRDSDASTLLEEVETRMVEWEEGQPAKQGHRLAARATNSLATVAYAAGGVTLLRWVAFGSETCPLCQELDGRVAGVNAPFVREGDTVAADSDQPMTASHGISHPPLHDGCVCQITPG